MDFRTRLIFAEEALMNGAQELNRLDLELLNEINREWQAERQAMAKRDHLLRSKSSGAESHRRRRKVWMALAAAVLAALFIGLAVAAASASGGAISLAL
jgi:hypothetical protein